MPNYQNTKVYKITCPGPEIYIGSTTKIYLSQRYQQHRTDYRNFLKNSGKNDQLFELFKKYGPENCNIELIEACPCTNIDSERKNKNKYIRELDCINKIPIPVPVPVPVLDV